MFARFQRFDCAYGIGVETFRAVDEIALKYEIPAPRYDERYRQSRCRIVAVGSESYVFEPVPVGERVVESLCAQGIERDAACPDHGVFHYYSAPVAFRGMECEAVVYYAIHHAARHSSGGGGEPWCQVHPGEQSETQKHVDPRCSLRRCYRTQEGGHQRVAVHQGVPYAFGFL